MEQVQLAVDVAVYFFAGGTGVDEMPRGCRSHYSVTKFVELEEGGGNPANILKNL